MYWPEFSAPESKGMPNNSEENVEDGKDKHF